jgi:hypothetical protein
MSMLILMMVLSGAQSAEELIHLKAGFVHKVSCEGKPFISVVGNDAIVRLEALPEELGCGVILKPLVSSGKTNLVLETSVGTIQKNIQISGK